MKRDNTEKPRQTRTTKFTDYINPQTPCTKHPTNPSPVGVCASCLNEELVRLLRSDHHISLSSRRNSISSAAELELDAVGELSFFAGHDEKSLRRSNSSCGEAKRRSGSSFWRIKGLFGKRGRNKGRESNFGFSEDRRDINWGSDYGFVQMAELAGDYTNCGVKNTSDFSALDESFIDLKLDLL